MTVLDGLLAASASGGSMLSSRFTDAAIFQKPPLVAPQ
jgi:hypothetical protein